VGCRRPTEGPRNLASVRAVEPGDLHQLVQEAFNSKDVDALVALYEPNAWLFGPDGPVQGHDAIRDTWAGFVAMDAQLELVTQYVVLQDEIALLSNRWTARIGDDEM
jgi:ketosteroid isomerase-like protein